jgi:hypothetical protein
MFALMQGVVALRMTMSGDVVGLSLGCGGGGRAGRPERSAAMGEGVGSLCGGVSDGSLDVPG